MDDEKNSQRSQAEPSAKDQLEGRLGEIDKLVMMMALMKSLMTSTPPPSPSPTAGLPLPPPPGVGLGGPTLGGPPPMGGMGPMGPPIPGGPGGPPGMGMMGGGPNPMLQQALMASKGLV